MVNTVIINWWEYLIKCVPRTLNVGHYSLADEQSKYFVITASPCRILLVVDENHIWEQKLVQSRTFFTKLRHLKMLIPFICNFFFPTTNSLLLITTQLLHSMRNHFKIDRECNELKLKSVAI